MFIHANKVVKVRVRAVLDRIHIWFGTATAPKIVVRHDMEAKLQASRVSTWKHSEQHYVNTLNTAID